MSHMPFLTHLRQALLQSTLPLALVAAMPAVAQAFSFERAYVFGDSLSDVGQLSNATFGFFPPVGPDPSRPYYFDGRFSNGPLWVEYLAPKLGISNPAINFAFAGANTNDQNTAIPGLSIFPGLRQQVAVFTTNPPPVDPNALFIIWAGANDYLGGKQSDPTIPVKNLENEIRTLVNANARNILVANLPNLGLLPGTRPDPQTSAGLNFLTTAHNTLLSSRLTQLSREFGSKVNLIPFDANALFNQALTNPGQFGFTNTTDACLSPSQLVLRFPPVLSSICDQPDQYLFWDELHPTTKTHYYLAESAYAAIAAPVPEPSAVAGLLMVGALAQQVLSRKTKQRSCKTGE